LDPDWAAMSRLFELVDLILRVALEVDRRFSARSGHSILGEVDDALGLGLDPNDSGHTGFLTGLALFTEPVSQVVESWQRSIAGRLAPRERRQYRAMTAMDPQVWCVAPGPGSRLRGAPLLGPDRNVAVPVDAVMGYSGASAIGTFVGWPIALDGCRVLFGAVALDEYATSWLVDQAQDMGLLDHSTCWGVLSCEILACVARTGELDDGADYEDWDFDLHAQDREQSRLRRRVLADLEANQRGQFRIWVAEARGRGEVERVVAAAREARNAYLPEWMHFGEASEADAVLPLAELLGYFGLSENLELGGERLARAERAPLRVLGLPDDRLARLGLEEHMPLGAVAATLATRPDGPERAFVLEALERFRTQQRWLQTFEASGEADVSLPFGLRYDSVLTGLMKLFDGDLLETPLSALSLPRGALKRLCNALAASGMDPPECVGDLPDRFSRIARVSGIGEVTVSGLVDGILELARRWRFEQAGVDLTLVEARAERAPAVDATLREGLEELERLFG
jgi:hypothetical protein